MAAPTPSIEKLQKKLEKEPNSLIFLQLAEEYRKESLYEDAIRTCRDGLRRHPNYWSARFTMGRIYFEMGDQEKALEELEIVAKAVPDHHHANKLLGGIYMETGRMADALKRYQLVQMLAPNDQEVIANLQKIEEHLTAAARPAPPPAPPPPPVASEPAPEPTLEIQTPAEVNAVAAQPPDEVPSFLEKTAPGTRAAGVDSLDSTMPHEPSEPVVSAPPPRPEANLEALFLESVHSNEMPAASPFPSSEEEAFPSFAPGQAEVTATPLNPPPPAVGQQRAEDRTQPMKEDTGEFEGDELTTQTLAELYVQQGMTDKAVKVFQKLLLNDPGNTQVTQRLRDLSPADALLSMASSQDSVPQAEESLSRRTATAMQTSGPATPQSEDRQRKITTLENWLAAIRRERS